MQLRRDLPAGWFLQHPSPQGCSSTPVQLLSRELIPSENKRGASLRTAAQRWGGKHNLCLSCLKESWPCLRRSQANSKAKQYVRTKGSIYFKRRLAAWKAFLICLCLFGMLNGWLQPVKYISVSEALLSSKTNSFIAQCFKLSIFFFLLSCKEKLTWQKKEDFKTMWWNIFGLQIHFDIFSCLALFLKKTLTMANQKT